jgi:hypothetical protein
LGGQMGKNSSPGALRRQATRKKFGDVNRENLKHTPYRALPTFK